MTNREIFQEVFWRTVSIETSSLFAVSMVQDILVSVLRCIIQLILDFDWRLKPRWQDTTKTLQRARNKIALYQTDYILRHAPVALCRKEVAIEWLQLSCNNKQHSHVAKIKLVYIMRLSCCMSHVLVASGKHGWRLKLSGNIQPESWAEKNFHVKNVWRLFV